MAVNTSRLGSISYKAEAAWAEAVTTMTDAVRLPILTPVDLSGLTHEMVAPGRVTQYLDEGTPGIKGIMGGSFSFDLWLHGYGGATSGATAATWLSDLLGWVLGGSGVTAANGTTDNGGGASTTTNIVTTAANGFAAGGMFRVGSKADAGGDGQWATVTSHAANALVPKFALPAAPANGAVIHSAAIAYTTQGPSSLSLTGQRFRLMTADLQAVCHGCFPTAIAFSGFNPGEIPKVTITVGVSWWEPVAATFPDTTAVTSTMGAPHAAGSFQLKAYGSTTRTSYTLRACSINFTLGMTPLPCNDGVNAYQKWGGARRQPNDITVSLVGDSEAATTAPVHFTNWADATNLWHAQFSISTISGQALGFNLPRCCYDGNRPLQQAVEEINRVPFMLRAYADHAITTSDLTLSSFVLGMA